MTSVLKSPILVAIKAYFKELINLNAFSLEPARIVRMAPPSPPNCSSTIYLHSTQEEQEHAGVYDDTIRISVGLEDVEDLIEDFTQAVKNI